jgi:hypothetical protein
MTCHDLTLTFDQIALAVARPREARAFRILLQPGEALRIPRKAWTLRVVTGNAWVAQSGIDHTLGPGDTLALPRTRYAAVVSAEGRPLFIELS